MRCSSRVDGRFFRGARLWKPLKRLQFVTSISIAPLKRGVHETSHSGVSNIRESWFFWALALSQLVLLGCVGPRSPAPNGQARTLGWPEPTEDLAYFYPTDLMITGRDILYLWVARMIMTGEEFMGKEPFREVLVHATGSPSGGPPACRLVFGSFQRKASLSG